MQRKMITYVSYLSLHPSQCVCVSVCVCVCVILYLDYLKKFLTDFNEI